MAGHREDDERKADGKVNCDTCGCPLPADPNWFLGDYTCMSCQGKQERE